MCLWLHYHHLDYLIDILMVSWSEDEEEKNSPILFASIEDMSHKTIAQNFLHMIMTWEVRKAFDTYIAQDFIHHNQYTKPGREELLLGMEGNQDNFPDKTFATEMMLEEDDKVMTYSLLKFTAEHKGVRVVHIFRFDNDMIVEMRDVAMQVE